MKKESFKAKKRSLKKSNRINSAVRMRPRGGIRN